MMSLSNKLSTIGAELKIAVPNTFHYWRAQMNAPFLVWQEQGETSAFDASNIKQEQVVECSCDYYTHTEYDEAIDRIQEILNKTASWRLNSVQYEEDTNLIHYEWIFEV